MFSKRRSKSGFKGAVFGLFLALFAIITPVVSLAMPVGEVYAEENTSQKTFDEGCQESLGKISWWICPMTEKVADAVDFLYEKIQDILIIDPVEVKDGAPIYEIWKYCRGITNVIFIIFLLIVIYSQLTGLGISNYGIKRVMPKLIVVAILVNLSFLICTLAVDISNIVGTSLRGVFSSVEQTTLTTMSAGAEMSAEDLALEEANAFALLADGGTLFGVATVIAFETGAIFMMIPAALGAIVAVVTGLITIALRQAVVALLVMISPLAVVAYMLPNTENLFKRWRKLLTQMLTFYPMFSLLFGAASLAGFAIIAGATDGFGLLLGTAVQVFPLFFSWKLMQMSGTFLGAVNTTMRSLAAGPLAKNREWANSHRELMKRNNLNRGGPTPSLRLMQFMDNRRIGREADLTEAEELRKNRALANRASRNWKGKGATGAPTRRGRAAYARQAQGLEYQRTIAQDKNTMNKGLAGFATTRAEHLRLGKLDARMIEASDSLKVELARGELIEHENAAGYHKRMNNAMNAHFDETHRSEIGYEQHKMSEKDREEATERYAKALSIMDGDKSAVQYAAANAAHGFVVSAKVQGGKYLTYFNSTVPTRDVIDRLNELTGQMPSGPKMADRIDAIIPGLKTLVARGDTDEIEGQLRQMFENDGGIELGTHASQSLASFLMFDTREKDVGLRRFGKYINLETAHVYNKQKELGKRRYNTQLTMDEYVTGQFVDYDAPFDPENPEAARTTRWNKSKMKLTDLVKGTSFDGVERTAFVSLDNLIRRAYTDSDGRLDVEKYIKERKELWNSTGAALISASLKFLSGSEQLTNEVDFLSGYSHKKGKYIWEDDELYKKMTPAERGEAEKSLKGMFRGQMVEFFKGQTAGQILAQRSDFKDVEMDLLSDAWLNPSDEEKAKREMNSFVSGSLGGWETDKDRMDALEGDLASARASGDSDQIKRAEKEINDFKGEMMGKEMLMLAHESGQLSSVFTAVEHGRASGTKPWMMKNMKLTDIAFMDEYLEQMKRKKKKRAEVIAEGDAGDTEGGGHGMSDADFREAIKNELDEYAQNHTSGGPDEAYSGLKNILDSHSGVGPDLSVLISDFESIFHVPGSFEGGASEMVDWLKSEIDGLGDDSES